jgi:hypothetical protein
MAEKAKIALTSFVSTVGKDDVEYIVREGDQLSVSHPVVKAHPELFTETTMEETR